MKDILKGVGLGFLWWVLIVIAVLMTGKGTGFIYIDF